MLCANIMLNNVFHLVAPFVLGSAPGQMEIPFLDPIRSASHGSLSLRVTFHSRYRAAHRVNKRTMCTVTTSGWTGGSHWALDVLKIVRRYGT